MRTAITSASTLEHMAENSGRNIEIHGDVAYLQLRGIVWTAQLEPAGGAR